jgi:hypothetical protein
MNNVSSAALRRRRQQLVRALPQLEQIIRGSLIETYKRCGRSSCHCNNGPGHGPKRYLSTVARTGDRARLGYVPNATYPQVADFLANYRKLQEMLNEIRALNAESLTLALTLSYATQSIWGSLQRCWRQRPLSYRHGAIGRGAHSLRPLAESSLGGVLPDSRARS